jgi:hypothetical protein
MNRKSITYLKALSLLLLFLLQGFYPHAQTNPQPYNLGLGTYEFTYWDSLSPAGTYPPNMVFHYVSANQAAPFYVNGSSDYDCAYHKSKRPRINGLMQQGIALVTTSSSQYNDCDAGAADLRFIGDVVLALNTNQRSNIRLRWKSETATPGDGNGIPSNPRVWNLRLQYRIGEAGLFSDFTPAPVEFVSSVSSGDSVQFGPLQLPAECNNKQVVQLRWIYFESSAGAGGSRPNLRLDDVEVSSENSVGTEETLSNNPFSVFPNPASGQFTLKNTFPDKGELQVIDSFGRIVLKQFCSQQNTTIDCTGIPAGIYLVKFVQNAQAYSVTRKLILQ